MAIKFIPGEYFVKVCRFTRARPKTLIRVDIVWHRTDSTVNEAWEVASRLRAEMDLRYCHVLCGQAYEEIPD